MFTSYFSKKVGLVLAFLILTYTVNAQAVLKSSVTKIGKDANVIINKPAGVVKNDLLIVGLMYEKGTNEVITPPPGWTFILKTNYETDCGLATFYKIASDSEPISYTFKLKEGSKWSIGISRISNVKTESPIFVYRGIAGVYHLPITAPSINVAEDNTLVLCFFTNKKGFNLMPEEDDLLIRYNAPNYVEGQPSNMLATFVQSTTGATGNRTAWSPELEKWSGQQIAISGTIVPLPVELISFTASTCRKTQVCLEWQTASEVNNDSFIVERSEDGEKWQQIAKVKGTGNSSVRKSYETTDHAPLIGRNYYRLKQVDLDGRFEYFKTISVDVNALKTSDLKPFPNPAKNYITLTGVKADEQINVFDYTGKRVDVPVKDKISGLLTLDLVNLRKGVYVVKLQHSTYKILKD